MLRIDLGRLGRSPQSSAVRRFLKAMLRLRAERSAVSAVEFGFVAPIFVLMIVEILQIGVYLYASASLDAATNYAARQILTGAVANSSNTTAALFKSNVLCPALPGSMSSNSCANVIVNVQSVSDAVQPGGFYAFVNSNQTAVLQPAGMATGGAIQTNYCPGIAGSYTYVQVYYAMPVFSPSWYAVGSNLFNGSTVHFVSAAAAFKNEPFVTTTQSNSQTGC